MTDHTATLERIRETGVVAIMRGIDADDAVAAVRAIAEGGVTTVEITANTEGAIAMIDEVTDRVDDDVQVGVGTVLDAETARAALLAGASFVVTPTVDCGVIETCNRYGAPSLVGAATPTESLRAYEAGADMVKVFPASSLGPGHVGSVGGPLGQIPLVPTGGVSLDNADAFLDAGAAALGVGSSIVDLDAVERGEFEMLTDNAAAFREHVTAARED